MKQVIIVAAIVVGFCVTYVLAHLALIEIGREVVVVYEPTPTGVAHKARLWIVDDGRYSWIHPGSANAEWWIRHMDANPILRSIEAARCGGTTRYLILRRTRRSISCCVRNTAWLTGGYVSSWAPTLGAAFSLGAKGAKRSPSDSNLSKDRADPQW